MLKRETWWPYVIIIPVNASRAWRQSSAGGVRARGLETNVTTEFNADDVLRSLHLPQCDDMYGTKAIAKLAEG